VLDTSAGGVDQEYQGKPWIKRLYGSRSVGQPNARSIDAVTITGDCRTEKIGH
jgi:hypothetical protein